MTSIRRRRRAETLVILGLSLMSVTAVTWADAPAASQAQVAATPTPAATAAAPLLTPTPTAAPTTIAPDPTASPEPTAAPVETGTPVPTAATPVPTATPTAAASATPTPSATATPRAPAAERFTFVGAAKQAPSPTPTPVATADPTFTGATLTACRFDEATGRFTSVVLSSDDVDNPIFVEETAIIPAPPSGCENVTDRDEALNERIRVCHATGDPARPYVLTEPRADGQTDGHELHRGDIIPAPRNSCPGVVTYGVPTPAPTATANPTRTPQPAATPTATPGDGTSEDDGDTGGLDPLGEALDDIAAGVDPTSTAGVDETAVRAAALTGEQLPFTGPEHLALLFGLGAGLVLTGAGLRRLAE